MRDSPLHDFGTAELDPDLLLTPFKVQTNWFRTVPETAHLYIERELALGRKLKEILNNRVDVQGILIEMQLEIERELQANEVTFLDRALPDSLAFNRYVGLSPNDLLSECFHHRYASVFILDPIPFQENGVRDEDSGTVDYLVLERLSEQELI
jgi:predicted ATPase